MNHRNNMDVVLNYYKTFIVPIFSSYFYFVVAFCFTVVVVSLYFLGFNIDFVLKFLLVIWVCHLVTGLIHVVEDYSFDVLMRMIFCSLLNLVFFKLLYLVIFV